MASVTKLLKDFDIYKRKQGVKSLHECCGIEFLTLLEGVMAVDIPDAADGDDPLRELLIDTFETPETFDSRFKAECKALAMAKGKQANIEDLQNYLSDFYSLIQGFVDRGQIEDIDDPDFNHTLNLYFMANVEPLEMRNKMQEFRASTFSAALKRFRKYLNPDIIALVNHTRAQNIAKHAETTPFDYQKSREYPRKANIVSTTGSPPLSETFQCDTALSTAFLVTTRQRTVSRSPANDVKLRASLTSTDNIAALILEDTSQSQAHHGKLGLLHDSPDQSLVASPNRLLHTAHPIHPDHLHHPGPSCPPRIFFMCILTMTTKSITTPKGRTKMRSAPVTATPSGVTAMDSSVFSPQLATLFGFLCFSPSHVHHFLALAASYITLPSPRLTP